MPKRKRLFSSEKKEQAQASASSRVNSVAKQRAIEAQFRRMQEKRARKARVNIEKESRLQELRQEREAEVLQAKKEEERRRREGAARRAQLQAEITKRKREEEKRQQKLEEAVFKGQDLDLEEVPLPEPIVPKDLEIEEELDPIKPKQKEEDTAKREEEEAKEQVLVSSDSSEESVVRKTRQGQVEIIKTGSSSPRVLKKRGKKKKRSGKTKTRSPQEGLSFLRVQKELKRIYSDYQEKQAMRHSRQNKEALMRAREKIDPSYSAEGKKRDPRLAKALSFLLRDRQTPLGKQWHQWREKRLKDNLKDVVGLDIGASAIRAVYPSAQGQVLLAERSLPEGLILAGILQDSDELAEEIKSLWKEAAIASKKVNFSLASELLAVRTVFLPSGDEQDIASALALNADAIIAPMRAEESVIDYKNLLRSGPDMALQVSAADRTVTETYLDAVRSAGLLPISCQAGPLAASRTVVVPRNPLGSHALIDIGAETTKILACSGPDSFYLRVIPIAGNHFTRAIMKELGVDWQQAEELKLSSSLEEGASDKTLLKIQQPLADRLAQEILQSKERYSVSEIGEKRPLESCLFLGGGSLLAGLREQIRFFAGFEDILEIIPATDIEDVETLGFFSPAIGLALGSDTSLLPEKGAGFWRPGITARVSGESKQGKRIITREKRRVSPLLLSLLLSVIVLTAAMLWKNSIETNNQSLRDQVALEDKIIANNQGQAKISWQNLSEWIKTNQVQVISMNKISGAQEMTILWSRSFEALRLGLTRKGFVIREIRLVSGKTKRKVKVVLENEG